MTLSLADVDPFEMPEWLVTEEVTWVPDQPLHGTHLVPGSLRAPDRDLACDLLAADDAFPLLAADEAVRARAHQAWHHHQVHLGMSDGRLTVVVPGSRFSAELAMEAVTRLARALGADPRHYAVLLRLGSGSSK